MMARPNAIRAQRFELVDGSGQIRGALGLDSEGQPGLALLSAGVVRVAIRLSEDQPEIYIAGKDGHPRVRLTVGDSGTAALSILDETGVRLYIGLDSDGDAINVAFPKPAAPKPPNVAGKIIRFPRRRPHP